MLQPLKIAKQTFFSNLIQGPLAGYSCSAFRLLTWEYSKPAFTCTEMISASAMSHQPALSQYRYIAKDPKEGPVCFQIFGNDPQKIGNATKIITDLGASLIDINCGCPVKKVRKQGAGSSLLTQPKLLYKLLAAMKNNTHLPIAAKIRVENNSQDKFHDDIIKVIKDSGIDFLVVHGRHWNNTYKNPCNYEHIKFFVDELTIPVIGNGDIFDVASLKKMLATGCAGAMIGRAGIGQPWLIQKLTAEINSISYSPPSKKEIGQVFLRHVELLKDLLKNERFALLQSRKIAGAYTQGMENKKEFCAAVNECDSLEKLEKCCLNYFS